MRLWTITWITGIACVSGSLGQTPPPASPPSLPPPRSAKEATVQLPQRATQAIGETRQTLGDIQQVLPQLQREVDGMRKDVAAVRQDVAKASENVGQARGDVAAAHGQLDTFLRRIATPALFLLWSLAVLVIVFIIRLVLPIRRHSPT